MNPKAHGPASRPRCPEVLRSLAAAQKSSQGVSYYSRLVNRPVGRVLASAAIGVGLSANAVTTLSIVASGAGLALVVLSPPSAGRGVAVAMLLALGFALDSADGQVARYTGTGSPAGEWYDHVVDSVKMVAVHAAVLVAWYRFDVPPSDTWLLLPIAFQLVATALLAGGTLAPLVAGSSLAYRQRSHSTLRALFLIPVDYGVICWSFVLWGAPSAHVVAYLVLGAYQLLMTAALLRRWFVQLTPLP